MSDNLMNFRVFYRRFGPKGKVVSKIVKAPNEHKAEKEFKSLNPRASVVAVFRLNKVKAKIA